MKLLLNIVLTGCLAAIGIIPVNAQTVEFHYVAPTAIINSTFPGVGTTAGMPGGYSEVVITNANRAAFLGIVSNRLRYVFTNLQPGAVLRGQVEKVFNNSDRTVDVRYYPVNDSTGIPAGGGHMFMPYIDNGTTYVWPAANGMGPLANGRYLGWVMLGEHQLDHDQATRIGGIHAIDEVVLHESSHTQWVGDWTKWGAVGGMAITYGADGMHYFKIAEILGDQEGAINEGLATYYGFTLNPDAMDTLISDFSKTGARYFVEGRSVMAGDPDLTGVAARQRDVLRNRNGVVHYPDGSDVVIFTYTWRDVPGFELLFAESTSTAFYSLFWRNAYANRDTSFSFIGYSSNSMHIGRMKRYLTYSCNRLALKMEDYNQGAAGQADASKTSSLLPFAILDLLTHFAMSDADYRADYDRNYPDRQPRAYVEYFNRRAAIRALVQPDISGPNINFTSAMQKIKTYCQQPANMF